MSANHKMCQSKIFPSHPTINKDSPPQNSRNMEQLKFNKLIEVNK